MSVLHCRSIAPTFLLDHSFNVAYVLFLMIGSLADTLTEGTTEEELEGSKSVLHTARHHQLNRHSNSDDNDQELDVDVDVNDVSTHLSHAHQGYIKVRTEGSRHGENALVDTNNIELSVL